MRHDNLPHEENGAMRDLLILGNGVHNLEMAEMV